MRLIDANALSRYANNTKDKTIDANDIMRFPAVEIPHWIPVTERLPEHEDHVLCCTATAKGRKNIVIGYYCRDLERWASGMNSNVIAWMPLPEPYKEESSLPSAQSELDEWCTDCKEYDQERHCCPRFRSVIREVAEEVRQTELPEPHYCRECKWSWCHVNVGKHGETETYWRCLNWDGETDEEGYCHEWERRPDATFK